MTWIISKALMEAYANSHCSQEQEAGYSEGNFSDGEQYAPLNVIVTPHPFWLRDKTTDILNHSRFGQMSRSLTADHGEAVLTWFLEGFHVRTSARREKELGSEGADLDCGERWRGLSAKYDRDTHSWKTHHCLFQEDLPWSSVALPNWGMCADGELWELMTLPDFTGGSGSGSGVSWRTPAAQEPGVKAERLIPIEGGDLGGMNRHFDKHTGRMAQIGLEQQVKLRQNWLTPRASDIGSGENPETFVKRMGDRTMNCDQSLPAQVRRRQNWPTPTANEDAAWTPDGKMQWMLTQAAKSGCATRAEYQGRGKDRQTYPTPTSSMVTSADMEQARYAGSDPNRPSYQDAKKTWATPQARDFRTGGADRWDDPNRTRNLNDQVAKAHSFPTPGTTGMSNGTGNCEKANKLHEDGVIDEDTRRSMRAGNGGQLNPDWVEWLMGWVIGWTRLEPLPVMDWRSWDVDPADLPPDHPDYIPRVATGIENRIDRLRAIGNGQVPLTASTAWRTLGGL